MPAELMRTEQQQFDFSFLTSTVKSEALIDGFAACYRLTFLSTLSATHLGARLVALNSPTFKNWTQFSDTLSNPSAWIEVPGPRSLTLLCLGWGKDILSGRGCYERGQNKSRWHRGFIPRVKAFCKDMLRRLKPLDLWYGLILQSGL